MLEEREPLTVATRPHGKIRGPGYRRAAKVYRLTFADEDLAGLEVRAKSVSTGKFLDLTKLADLGDGSPGPEQMEQVRELFAGFAAVLVSWNLEDEETGEPVPATLAGLLEQEFDFVLQIIMAWLDAISGVAAPLAPPSSAGTTTLEASLPMAPLSESQEAWSTPS